VGEATNGYEAVGMTQMLKPDVILMDLVMPQMNGIEATMRLREDNEISAMIIGVSSIHDTHLIHAAIVAGVDTFVSKDIQPENLITVIKCIVEKTVILPDITLYSLLRDLPQRSYDTLTEQDKVLLKLLGKQVTDVEIADHLQTDVANVREMMSELQTKLHIKSRLLLVLHAIKASQSL
jgi:DNA-binding NarL/FixJ family response regulator